jgi:hypothetical protein
MFGKKMDKGELVRKMSGAPEDETPAAIAFQVFRDLNPVGGGITWSEWRRACTPIFNSPTKDLAAAVKWLEKTGFIKAGEDAGEGGHENRVYYLCAQNNAGTTPEGRRS